MIFKVVLNGSKVIYDGNNPTGILDPQLEIEINAAGSFTFILPSGSDIINEITPFTSEIDVYEDEEMIWFGRVLNKEKLWYNQCKITCEGGLAYFNDSIQDKKTWESTRTENQEGVVYDVLVGGYFDGNGDPIPNPYLASDGDVTMAMFFRDLIDWHNGQVSENMQWEVGTIATEYAIEKIWRETNRETTSDCLQTMCLDTTGGYFITRKEYVDDPTKGRIAKRYIDWLDEMPYGSTQNIEFGVNLLDISNSINGADICTVLVPIGADELTINEVPDTGSKKSPVDGCYHVYGTDTVIYAESEAVYGRVQKTKTWSDITDKESLYLKAVEYLKEQNTNIPSIECSAAELHYLGGEYQGKSAFRVGQLVQVASDVHGIVGEYPLLKISMSLNSGAKRVTIGTPPKKELTDIVKNTSGSSSRNTSGGSSGGSGGSGGGGYVGVKDVRLKKPGDVEYESTVKNKVSKIDLSNMVCDVKLDGQSVVTEGQALLPAYPNAVEGNPLQLVDSGDLRKIKIGNHVFSIPEGGGGSGGDSEFEVEEIAAKAYSWTIDYDPYPNPRTDLPVSLQISSNRNLYFDVYSLRLNYDAFLLLVDFDAPKSASELETYTPKYTPFCIPVSMIDEATAHDYSTSISYDYDGIQYDFGYIAWTFRHGDNRIYLMLNHTSFGESGSDYPNNGRVIGPLYGIKFGGGGGVKDVLLDGVSVVDPTTKTADFDSSEFGTTVEANPSETATDDLTTIKIGDTVYDIPGGSGSGGQQYTCDLLFKNDPLPSPTSGTSKATRTYTLEHSIDDYDAIYAVAHSYYNGSRTNDKISCLILKKDYALYETTPMYMNGATKEIDRRLYLFITSNTQLTTDAIRSESGIEPILYKVYGLKFTSSTTINYPDIYTDYEREVGVWIDGKPLYQITKEITTTSTSDVGYDIGLDSTMNIIDYDAYIKILTSQNETIANYYMAGNDYCNTYINLSDLKLHINPSTSWGNVLVRFTMRYTKTTDQPGSGHWLPGGTTAISYSEDEQIIGQWIDGKTLYQKTYSGVTLTPNGDTIIDSNFGLTKVIQTQHIELKGMSTTQDKGNFNQNLTDTLYVDSNGQLLYYLYSSGSWWQACNAVDITIQYTKTTDDTSAPHPVVLATQEELEAVAYHYRDHCYTTLSDYYSTDERVVGVWTDGKPLYQLTFDTPALSNVSWNDFYISSLSDIETFVDSKVLVHDITSDNVPWEYTLGSGNDADYESQLWHDSNDTTHFQLYIRRPLFNSAYATITIQYTKTTDTAGTGPTPGNLVYLPALYSEEEREIGVWIDGKPLYQKTVTVNSADISSGWNYISNMGSSNGIEAHNVFGEVFRKDGNNEYRDIFNGWTSSEDTCVVTQRPQGIEFKVNSTLMSNLNRVVITIQYTKTTDTAGSGKYLPDGQYAHHYSTSEHVVGTWIDGKTLYERTWDFGSDVTLTASNWVNTGINLLQEFGGYIFIVDAKAQNSVGNYRGQIQAAGDGIEVQILSSGVATTVRYITLRYMKLS